MTVYEALMNFYPLTLDDLPDEVWKDFNGYHVSNFGRVKSFKRGKQMILKPMVDKKGYLSVALYKDGVRKYFYVHRLVARAFIPNPENKREVNHIDGHPLNNHVSNLEWCTQSENRQHAYDIGLNKSRVSKAQAEYIRNNPDNLNLVQLADLFGVCQTSISEIQLGKIWKKTGGSIRGKIRGRIPDDVRNQIKAEYKKGVYGCGSEILAKKYGVAHQTILNIIQKK